MSDGAPFEVEWLNFVGLVFTMILEMFYIDKVLVYFNVTPFQLGCAIVVINALLLLYLFTSDMKEKWIKKKMDAFLNL